MESPPDPPEGVGVLDDRYELVELIGSGGMAEVWRARDKRLGRDVAVKVLSGPSARDASMRKRIEREARALAALSHPNIVSVYDYGETEGPSSEVQPYVVMELVDGVDLDRYLETHGPLAADEATGLLRAVLAAVARAHGAGIVHGDLKPANVFLSSDGPKVGDFGVARILAEETGTTTVAATPSFAAPDVLRGERPTAASDVCSAACLAFQMVAGRAPYEGANAWEVAAKHLESADAAGQLSLDGFLADVSYRPVTSGDVDVVLETIPSSGAMVQRGTKVHIIASALAQTPEPIRQADSDTGRGKGKKDRDEDDQVKA